MEIMNMAAQIVVTGTNDVDTIVFVIKDSAKRGDNIYPRSQSISGDID